ncbi:MAG: phospholipase [Pirellulales bacterium]|nr:phospholipase [Pirellulales bacterium]
MALTAELLRQLHRIHTQLADLRDRLDRGPRRIQVHQRNVEQMEAALAAAQDAVKQTKLRIDRKQLDLKANETKVAELKVKLNAAASNKEYQALVDQIAATEMAGSVLADEILEAFDKVDALQVAVAEAEKNVAAGRTELSKTRDTVAAESQVVTGDVARLEQELVEAEKKLPGDFRPEYNRLIRSKGSEGMAEMAGGVCQGCGQKVTLQMENDLMMDKAVSCKSCGRILYLGE